MRCPSSVLPSLAAVMLAGLVGGCSAPPATLDLITVARTALAEAQLAQDQQHQQLLSQLESSKASLDAAFDADVQLAAAGGIRDQDGNAVPMTPQWIISARKGYAAARDALDSQAQNMSAVHSQRQDNLRVADESLEMASQLILSQQSLDLRLQQQLLAAQQRLVGKK